MEGGGCPPFFFHAQSDPRLPTRQHPLPSQFHEITLSVDPLTHALASYTLKRAAFPRAPRSTTIAMLLAGTIAGIDSLSAHFGPSVFLTFCRTYFHSLLAALVFGLLVTLPFVRKHGPEEKQTSPLHLFIATFCAVVLHLLLDLCQSTGIELFWPISTRRFALDCLPRLDLWLLGILLAGILLPMLTPLVTDEIATTSNLPRRTIGASLALATTLLYLVLRFLTHGNAVAALESRTYPGESPRKVAAFAESGSPFHWLGIVETASALHDVEVDVVPGASLTPDAAIHSYKPQPSPAPDPPRHPA